MPQAYPKRLIEVDLPIARISAHARREKSIRHGHISTLHIWWARRPLAACRAVICASLWPDPADELCPPAFRAAAVEQITQFAARVFPKKVTEEGRLLASEKHCSPESRARWEAIAKGGLTLDADQPADWGILRLCLLDFIADFANWDNSTVPAYLETSRALTQAAHEALGGVPGTRPLVVDPFAGGGSIPLEALRVGADAFASDLNPVAVLLNKVVLEYIPKYGQRLADEVRKWGQWVKEEAEKELAEFYPKDQDGLTPIAYIWARTILSEAPGQGELPLEVPLIRSMWLAKRSTNRIALRWQTEDDGSVKTEVVAVSYNDGTVRRVKRPVLEVFYPTSDREVPSGTVNRGSATCPVTGFTTPVVNVRSQLSKRQGGASDSRLLVVVGTKDGVQGRLYRIPTPGDHNAIALAHDKYQLSVDSKDSSGLPVYPDEPLPPAGGLGFRVQPYGMTHWRQLFTPRQLVSLSCLSKLINASGESLRQTGESELADAVQTILAFCLDKQADLGNSLNRWEPIAQCPRQLFGRQTVNMVWDFSESVPLSDSSGGFLIFVKGIERALRGIGSDWGVGVTCIASATNHPLPDEAANCFITDPPYYDAIPYSDLSDFFFAWLKRTLPAGLRRDFADSTTPKEDECIVDRAKGKTKAFFEAHMTTSLIQGRRILAPSGIGLVVFAHKSTSGWESQLDALIEAGWTVSGSWPLDTENVSRLRAQDSAALTSSVHLVCRPRENEDGTLREEVGEWRDVLAELPQRIHEWMPRLAAEGVVGADAIFACLGPALEIFSRYSRVEKASGEAVPLREYLEQVWAAVSTEALSMIFRDADAAGLEPDARLTAMWLWTLGAGTGKAGGNGKAVTVVPGLVSDDEDDTPPPSKPVESSGYTLEYDAARKIAQGLGIHLEQSDTIVEVKGDKARLLPVSERTRHLFGKAEGGIPNAGKKKKTPVKQKSLFDQIEQLEAEAETEPGELKPTAGETVLDRVHQAMILFAAGRGEALRRFLVDDGAGKDARFWKLAQSLSALYPKETDEKRWVDGVLARKKGLGL